MIVWKWQCVGEIAPKIDHSSTWRCESKQRGFRNEESWEKPAEILRWSFYMDVQGIVMAGKVLEEKEETKPEL